jgi:CRISPR/Cas system-associated endoribonuclease Cas2
MQHIATLGRQPYLGLAELERVYGSDAVTPLYDSGAALLDVDLKADDLKRLGGSTKLAKVLVEIDSTQWRDIEKYLSKTIPEHLQYVPEGKFRLGVSVYGLDIKAETINVTNLKLKKIIKAEGRSVRVVPNKEPALNSAQVIHNQLTGQTGWELLLLRRGHKTILAQTIAEQDIDAYAARDQARPARDAFVGMLPPKLAQIMINLANGERRVKNEEKNLAILDPFCGTGVILQEALLMGYKVYRPV